MASNVNPTNIDANYPVAGQDNNSQGFRDNFSNIRNNLAFTKAELEDLQNKVLLKSALIGTTLNNNLNNEKLLGVQLQSFTRFFYDHGSISGTVTLNYSNGNYQKVASTGPITLAFSNWPASGIVGSMILHVSVTSTSHTLTLPAAVNVNSSSLQGINNSNNQITFPAVGEYVYEFSSFEGSNRYRITDLSQSRGLVKGRLTIDGSLVLSQGGAPASSSATGTAGQVGWDSNYLYVCVGTNSWKRVALSSF